MIAKWTTKNPLEASHSSAQTIVEKIRKGHELTTKKGTLCRGKVINKWKASFKDKEKLKEIERS